MIAQKISPCLWFDTQAEEAANFYITIFENSKILSVTHYGEAGYEIHGMPAGTVLTVRFQLDGQEFIALNGGPQFKFSEAVSLAIDCETQKEIDYYWEKLSEGGEKGQCGWLKDKFGLSWQTASNELQEKMLNDPDHEKSERVMTALLKMNKIDMQKLQDAYDG